MRSRTGSPVEAREVHERLRVLPSGVVSEDGVDVAPAEMVKKFNHLKRRARGRQEEG
ncbi:MAG: hypothetical protein M3305_14400 [Actinomycetota bacterium]|nr:hypothetical protein [Actinomycetota bacterium]